MARSSRNVRLAPRAPSTPSTSTTASSSPADRAHAAHTHGPDVEQVECFFIIEGEAEVQIEDEVRRLRAGQGAVINTRRLHGFRNAGEAPLRYVVMTAPGPPPAAAIGRVPSPPSSSPPSPPPTAQA